ncbi:MAG: hypothetical protein QXX87_01310 [Candidatus Jordarchaeales archaeon]
MKELRKDEWAYGDFSSVKENGIRWNTLEGCPCFTCSQISRCGAGQQISPNNCWKLTEYIDRCARKSSR